MISSMRSSGRLVPGGVRQGWMMGLMLLSIFTNDLDAGAERALSKLVDDIELGESLTAQRVALPLIEASRGWGNGLTGPS